MPSYIEFEKNPSIPSASDISRIILGINAFGSLETVDSNGNVTVIGSGSGGGVVNVVYNDLYSKVVSGSLTPGQWYRLTDYKSVNFLNGHNIAENNPIPTDPNFLPREIYSGSAEVLLLQATSPYQIGEIGYSETFEGDIVQYEPFTNKIGVNLLINNGYTLPDSSTVSGFDLQWDGTHVYFDMPTGYPALFGHYFYMYAEFYDGANYYFQDGNFEPLTPGISTCQYPYTSDDPTFSYPKAMSRLQVVNGGTKVILLDLTETDYNNYQTNTLYVETVYALGDAYGWITRRIDTYRNIDAPLDFRGRKYRRFEVNNTVLGLGYWGIGDTGTTGNYKDFKVLGNEGNDAYNIKWEDMGGPDGLYWYRGKQDNTVFQGSVHDVKIGAYCFDNTLGISFFLNTIGHNFYNNTIGNDFNYNTIGDYFQYNTIGDNFQFNTIGDYFQYNTIGNSFTFNKTDCAVVSLDFTSATHVYQDYNCEILKANGGNIYLSYFDGTAMQYVTPITS